MTSHFTKINKRDIDSFPGDSRLEFVSGYKKKPLYDHPDLAYLKIKRLSSRKSILIIMAILILIFILALSAALSRSGLRGVTSPAINTTYDYRMANESISDMQFFEDTKYRLPRSIKPLSYNVTISPEWLDVNSALPRNGPTFTGSVAFTFLVIEDTSIIVLNNKGLRFDRVTLQTHQTTQSLNNVNNNADNNVLLKSFTADIPSSHITYEDDKFEMVRIDLTETLAKSQQAGRSMGKTLRAGDQYILNIEYHGNISRSLNGLYGSTYSDTKGRKHYLLSTQFEPNYARRAFPCMDEPDRKAKFIMAIDRPVSLISLSNMPKAKTLASPVSVHLQRDVFEASVVMSTYLVAWVICDFKAVTDTTRNGVLVGVHAPEEQIDQANFALGVAVKAINFYNDFFDIPFPLPKIDLIGIPDFSVGAMENWGLVTYRMVDLLYKPNITSESQKERVAIVITHELAHQWFGNLVTMKWWDDLWLNEGFATYMESVCADAVFPEWKMLEKFAPDTAPRASFLDSLADSHPVSHATVVKPSDMQSMFDAISYNKGSLLLRMLDGLVLTRAVFQKGLHDYLSEHAYGNARSSDLWRALQKAREEASGINPSKDNSSLIWHVVSVDSNDSSNSTNPTIENIMNGWITQKGYPLVTISDPIHMDDYTLSQKQNTLSSQPNSKYLLDIYQNKFTNQFATEDKKERSNSMWQIPLTIMVNSPSNHATNENVNQLVWLHENNISHPVPFETSDVTEGRAWVKANVGYSGYYLVKYGPRTFSALLKALKDNANIINELDRTQLIFNMRNFVEFGYGSYVDFLEYLMYINPTVFNSSNSDTDLNEKASLPLMASLDSLNVLHMRFRYHSDPAVYQKLLPAYINKLLLNKLLQRYDTWKTNNELSHLDIFLQAKTIGMAVILGHEPTISKAKPLFQKWIHEYSNAKTNLPYPDLSSAILRSGIQYGTTEDWEAAWNAYKTSNVPSEKMEILSSLTTTTNMDLVERLLSYIKNGFNPPHSIEKSAKSVIDNDDENYIRSQDMVGVLGRLMISSPLQSVQERVWKFVKTEWPSFIEEFGDSSSALDGLVKAVCKYFGTNQLLNDYDSFFKEPLAQGLITQESYSQTREIITNNIASSKMNDEAIIAWLKKHIPSY